MVMVWQAYAIVTEWLWERQCRVREEGEHRARWEAKKGAVG